jgi:hypothetical protein
MDPSPIKTKQAKVDQENTLLQEYINTLTEKEQKAHHIAKSHLTCSFDLKKSIGFIEFVKAKTLTQATSAL